MISYFKHFCLFSLDEVTFSFVTIVVYPIFSIESLCFLKRRIKEYSIYKYILYLIYY